MTGIIAVMERNSSDNSDMDSHIISSAIVKKMYNYIDYKFFSYDVSGLSIRILCLDKDYHGFLQTSEYLIAWYGRPLFKGNKIDNDNVNELIQELVNYDLNNLKGHFELIFYSFNDRRFIAIADKVSTIPIYLLEFENYLIITPEPLSLKALYELGWKPSIRKGAIFEFLASGHLWGEGTFWEDVYRLGPGKYINCKEEQIEVNTYWEMVYENLNWDQETIQNELLYSIEQDFKTLPEGKILLTLSGGYDSRGLLGFLKGHYEGKFDTISYSFGEENQKSDANVGKYYANKVGIPHSHHKVDLTNINRLITDIEKVVVATGGESDVVVAQDSFLGITFYEQLYKNHDYLFRGDEVWGWGDYVINGQMAFVESLLFNLNELPHPSKILLAKQYEQGIEHLKDLRNREITEATKYNIKPNDLKDYIYWKNREARLLQNMRYFRNLYIPQFTPFTLDETLYCIKNIPAKYRVRKKYFRDIMRETFPQLFLDDNHPTPYLNFENRFEIIFKNEHFQSYIKYKLIINPPKSIESMMDREALERWINTIFNGEKYSHQAKGYYNLVLSINNLLSNSKNILPYIKFFTINLGLKKFPVQDENYLFRILVLSISLKNYETSE